MKTLVIAAVVVALSSPVIADEMYTWTDSDGSMHFVDDPSKIPAKEQKKAKIRPGAGKQITVESTRKIDTTERFATERDIQEYFELCKSSVYKRLKAPATARFGPMKTNFKTHWIDGKYALGFDVDAQNSYGALIRTGYTCLVDVDSRTVADIF